LPEILNQIRRRRRFLISGFWTYGKRCGRNFNAETPRREDFLNSFRYAADRSKSTTTQQRIK
jgi:hypothetical protein